MRAACTCMPVNGSGSAAQLSSPAAISVSVSMHASSAVVAASWSRFCPMADKRRPPVAMHRVPPRVLDRVLDRLCEALGPLVARYDGPPRRAWRHAKLGASKGQVDPPFVARGQPRSAFEPQKAAERAWTRLASKRSVQALRVEGPCRSVDERRDTILDRLGCVLVLARLGKPLRVRLCPSELEPLLAEQRGRLKLAVLGAQDLCHRVESPDHRLHLTKLHAVHEVDLIDQQHVCELDLVAKELGDGALVALASLPATINELIQALQLLEESRRVDDGHHVPEARDITQTRARRLILEGERLRDWQGLRDAGRLDEHVVEAALGGEGREGKQ